LSNYAPLCIVVFGAARTGRTRLVADLVTALASTRPAPLIAEGELSSQGRPLMAGSPTWDIRAPTPNLILLTGLDLPVPGALPDQQAAEDRRLRQALQAAGVGWRVVYGQGEQRSHHALQAVAEVAPWAWTAAVSEAEAGRWQRLAANCDKCGDADCEHRLFTGLPRD
jgi:hypothetical protein